MPRPSSETTGMAMKRLRKLSGMNQTELARHLGVSQPLVSAWELDDPTRRPPDEAIRVMETLFGQTIPTDGDAPAYRVRAVLQDMAMDAAYRARALEMLGVDESDIEALYHY